MIKHCQARLNAAGILPAVRLRNPVQKLMCIVSLCCLSACTPPQSLVAGDRISVDTPIYEQNLGSDQDVVLAAAGTYWQAETACEMEKTGVGINRRAYFLERCEYTNPQQQTVCNLAPESVEYAFLERSLVQVKYRFNESDADRYTACIQQQAEENGFTLSTEPLESDTAETQRVRLVNAATNVSITIGEEQEVRVYDTKVAPTVHMLRNRI